MYAKSLYITGRQNLQSPTRQHNFETDIAEPNWTDYPTDRTKSQSDRLTDIQNSTRKADRTRPDKLTG